MEKVKEEIEILKKEINRKLYQKPPLTENWIVVNNKGAKFISLAPFYDIGGIDEWLKAD